MAQPNPRPWLYRGAALFVFLIAQLVVLSLPLKMQEPDDWAFRYAAQHLWHGQLTVEDSQFIQDSTEIWQEGGQLITYGKVPGNRWALTRAPGYVFYLAPFEAVGAPWLGASLLSLGVSVVLYFLLARLRNEKIALLGVILLLFTPLYLAMWQRVYIDALAATALAGMGGGLYLYYWTRADRKSRWGQASLFAGGLLIAASAAVRYPNIAILLVFVLHILFMAGRAALRREKFLRPTLAFLMGLVLPFAGLFAYQAAVFGSPFTWGGHYAQLPATFAWSYLGSRTAFDIVKNNVIQLWAPLLMALPIIFIGVPAVVAALIPHLFPVRLKRWEDLPAPAWWLLAGWLVAVFGFYLFYEWTAGLQTALIPFTLGTRFYLVALFPLALAGAFALARFPARVWASILTVLVLIGIIFYLQTARLQIQFTAGTTPPTLSLPTEGSPRV